jgi:N-acetylglucosamine kinase-like BadF-type ATPase
LTELQKLKIHKSGDPSMTHYYIGVDGGGTKTSGVLADDKGEILARAETGSSNHYSNPIEVVKGNLSELFTRLFDQVQGSRDRLGAVGLGMAGVDRPADHELISGILKDLLPGVPFRLDNDGVIALKGGSSTGVGIIVISGTGSIALGLNGAGDRARAGGWGNVLGDEGSGYSIALKGLRAVCRAHDGRISATKLSALIYQHLGVDDATGVLGWIKQVQAAKDQIAALSRQVFEAAEEGDACALEILKEEAEELGLAVEAVAKKLFPKDRGEAYDVVVAGGNLRHSARFFGLFQSAVSQSLLGSTQARLPGVPVVQPAKEPVEGALVLARDLFLSLNA